MKFLLMSVQEAPQFIFLEIIVKQQQEESEEGEVKSCRDWVVRKLESMFFSIWSREWGKMLNAFVSQRKNNYPGRRPPRYLWQKM